MADIDLSQPDRSLGSMLGGNEVEKLRQSIHWARERHGVRYREIAEGCSSPEHSVRNFVSGKSVRPDNAFLGRLYRFFASNRHLLPEPLHEQTGRHVQSDMIRAVLPISDEDVKRVFDRYCGYYICFRRSYRPSKISVSWLHIMKENLPLPRFTLFNQFPDPIDGTPRSYIIIGYAITRKGRIYLTGHHDAELSHFILKEPLTRRFTYVQGLCLRVSSHDREPFSTRVTCQYLGSDASRDEWHDKIGIFSHEEFKGLFDKADLIIPSLGDPDVLITSKLE